MTETKTPEFTSKYSIVAPIYSLIIDVSNFNGYLTLENNASG